MPADPALISALIGAGSASASAGSTLIGGQRNRAFTREQNELNRRNAQNMYNLTRTHALRDRDYENWYNSPAQQMERLKAAGLNPRLIYGTSSGFQGSASTRPADNDVPEGEAPQFDLRAMQMAFEGLGGVMSKYIELSETTARTDNLKAQREVLEMQALLDKANIERIGVETRTGEYNLDYAKRTELNRTRKAIADIAFTEGENERRNWLMNEQKLKLSTEIDKIAAETRLTNQQLENLRLTQKILKSDSKIRQMEAYLNSKGMTLQNQNVINMLLRIVNQAEVGRELREIYKE